MVLLPTRALLALFLLASSVVSTSQDGTTATTATTVPPTPTPVACNNDHDLCPRPYNESLHLGAHKAHFLHDGAADDTANQWKSVTSALSAGIRLLHGHVYASWNDETLVLCHVGRCWDKVFQDASLQDWLFHIKTWLDANPNEAVTIMLDNKLNQTAPAFAAAFEHSGITKYAWPTLQAMNTANKRLITFIDPLLPGDPDPETNNPHQHAYLLDKFAHIFQTSRITQLQPPNNIVFTCDIERPADSAGIITAPGAALVADMLPLVHHFTYTNIMHPGDCYFPSASYAERTNSPDEREGSAFALGRHVRECMEQWGVQRKKPVFVLVDFYHLGDPFAVADRLNGLLPVGRQSDASCRGRWRAGCEVEGRGVVVMVVIGWIIWWAVKGPL